MSPIAAFCVGAHVSAAKIRPCGAVPSCAAAVGGIPDRCAVRVSWDLGSRDSVSLSVKTAKVTKGGVTMREGLTTVTISWPVDVSRVVAVIPTYTCHDVSDRIVVSDWSADGIAVRANASQIVDFSLYVLYV